MKKIILSITAVCAAFTMNAQVDTLTEFFTGAPAYYSATGGGYATGNNAYGDLAKMQLFDAATGVTNGGTITNLLTTIPAKAGTGVIELVIWENLAGAPGAELGSVSINLTDIDTTLMGFGIAGNWVYNVNATFASPIAIPANGSFWAGVILPPNTTGSIVIAGNTDGDFPLAVTHTGEFWSDNSFNFFGDPDNWDLNIAMMIFPVVDFIAGINENVISASVYPNPANDVLNIVVNEEISNVSIVSLDGKAVASSATKTVEVGGLTPGMYIYEVTTASGKVARNTFMKK